MWKIPVVLRAHFKHEGRSEARSTAQTSAWQSYICQRCEEQCSLTDTAVLAKSSYTGTAISPNSHFLCLILTAGFLTKLDGHQCFKVLVSWVDLAGLLGGLRPQYSATRAWGCPWHDAVHPYSMPGSGHGGKAERSAPLLLPASLRRKRKHLCLSWVDICGSGERGNLCEKLGWHQRQGVLLSLYILVPDSRHRHMRGATHSHRGGLLAHGFTKPSPCSQGFHQLSAISPHSAEEIFFSPSLPLQPWRALFSVKCVSPVSGTNHREL